MRKLIALIALLASLGMAGTAFAGGTAMTGTTSGAPVTITETPAFSYYGQAMTGTTRPGYSAPVAAISQTTAAQQIENATVPGGVMNLGHNGSATISILQGLGYFAAATFTVWRFSVK
jgi:hypothetical protein